MQQNNSHLILPKNPERDRALFVAFCIEEYAAAKGVTGRQAHMLLSEHGVVKYLTQCFEPLHTQGLQWLIAEIDEYIEKHPKAPEQ